MSTIGKVLPTPKEFEEQLAHFINVTLLGGDANVGRDTRLFEDGYMNSLRILDLIAIVEKTLDRRIPDRAVRLANFRTIAAIVAAFHPDAAVASAAPNALVDRPFERRGDRARFASPIATLEKRGDVTISAAGQVSLSGLALDVLHAVDRTVAQWAASLGAIEHRYPSLIDLGVLERAGQIESFPQHLTLAVHPLAPVSFRADQLSFRAEGEESAVPAAAQLQIPRFARNDNEARNDTALAPAVCYHAYPALQGTAIGDDGVVLTARGRCYRYEDGNHVPLERLWDFTMREIIVLGTRDRVESIRQSLMTRVSDLVTTLGLDATIAPASDPFFIAGDEGRRLMQQAGALKHELLLTVDTAGRAIAAASFNHHHDFFGTRFDITLASGGAAHSGCVAFGLERWVLAVFTQHGVDERLWPTAARTWLGAGA